MLVLICPQSLLVSKPAFTNRHNISLCIVSVLPQKHPMFCDIVALMAADEKLFMKSFTRTLLPTQSELMVNNLVNSVGAGCNSFGMAWNSNQLLSQFCVSLEDQFGYETVLLNLTSFYSVSSTNLQDDPLADPARAHFADPAFVVIPPSTRLLAGLLWPVNSCSDPYPS